MTEKLKMRLPQLGCFTIFGLFFIFSGFMTVALCRTVWNKPAVFDVPTQCVTVADPGGVLLKEDAAELERLATGIAEAGDCSVACMFVDERNADFLDLCNTILSEWRPAKGALLVCGTRNDYFRLILVGGTWRLAGWKSAAAARELARCSGRQRGRAAVALLKRLRRSLDLANAHREVRASGKPANPVLFSRAREQSGIKYPYLIAAAVAGLAILIGYTGLKNGKKMRDANLMNNPSVEAEFRQRSESEPALKLIDQNAESGNWMHARALKIVAIVLGIWWGISGAFSAFGDAAEPDLPHLAAASDVKAPLTGRVVDRAGVFSEEEKNKLAELIAKVEKSTGGEIGILTVDTVGSQSIEEFSLNAASAWKLGKAGKDNGAMLLLAIKDRKNRLEIGYGWEGPVNDAKAGDMLRSIVPELRAGKYAAAAAKVVVSIERAVLGLPKRDELSKLIDDRAGIFSEKDRQGIIRGLSKVARATGGGRIGIVTVRSTDGEPLREFALKNAPKGTLGRSAVRGGAVLVLAVDDKTAHVEIAPRWAKAVDRQYADAMARVLKKDFDAGNYALGAVKAALVIRNKVLKSGIDTNAPAVVKYAAVPVKAPARDPRVADRSGGAAAVLGIVGVLIGIVLGYRGRLMATSVPRLYVFDPTIVYSSSSSSDSDYGSSSSSSSSSSDSGGGGSFGGGGASGSW